MKSRPLALLLITLLSSAALAEDTAEVKMTLIKSGAMQKLGGYMPLRLELSDKKPDELKKAPDMTAPLYGSLKFGDTSYLVALDEPEGQDAKLYVDSNGNGDLTDEQPVTWKSRKYAGPNNQQFVQYSGEIKLPLGKGDKAELVSLGAYRFDKTDPQRAALKNSLFYYRDYAWDGEVTLNGAKYHAMLSDDRATGEPAKAARLMIDVNGDGQFSAKGESFDAAKPFNIKGTTWKLAEATAADGSPFKIVKSDEAVAEIKPPPDHGVGKQITAFKATKMDGAEVNFPTDYKGKIVMLDFWATWCGPCMGEVPGLVKAYEEFHPQGFEILGISLDQANAAEKVKTVTADKGMTWPQVYDGKFWKAAIADMYGINSIPSAFLVDGDTGKIIAAGESLRGENLAKTLKAALEKKKQTASAN
jgi:thiol-disulfide isomerase/thioredoxin